jgi:hypothetical protein
MPSSYRDCLARALVAWLALGASAWARPLVLVECNLPDASNVLSDCSMILFSPDTLGLYLDKKCQTPDCMRDVAYIESLNPTECLFRGFFRLYADATRPLRAHCATLTTAQPTLPPVTTPEAPPETPSPLVSTPTSAAPAKDVTKSPTSRTTTAPPSPVASLTTAPPTSGSGVDPKEPSTTTVPSVPKETPSSSAFRTPAPVPAGSSNDASGLVPVTTQTVPPKTRSPVAAPTGLRTAGDKSKGSTQWLVLALAAVGVVAVVLLWVYKRRQRAKASAKSMAPYAALSTPTDGVGSKAVTATVTATATTDSDALEGESPVLSAELRKLADERLNGDAVLGAWRLRGKPTTDKKFLGRGSHAYVHLVALPDGQLLASKRLAIDQVTLTQLTQLIGEVHIVSKLEHRSIVEFVGVTWTSALDFQALFEFMAGGDLREYLDTHPRTQDSESSVVWSPLKLRMALAVAEGLAYAHSFNPPLVHRDLKSRNILLTHDLRAKISDFGVSRFQSESNTMTTGVGTNRWLAPEVISGGGGYTERCDIYSFGVVLTELDTHDMPLVAELNVEQRDSRRRSELWLLQEIALGRVRPSLSASCPQGMRDLATRCLSLNPDDRPSALEVSYRLRSIINTKSH